VSVCLSKGLGAPVGSVLVSSAEAISRARVWRKRYGGGMRQVGVLAAAGHYALDHHVERLADDHAHATSIAIACATARPGVVDTASVQTNIVVLDLQGTGLTAPALVQDCRADGVVMSAFGARRVRLVTHLDLSDQDIAFACTVLARHLSK